MAGRKSGLVLAIIMHVINAVIITVSASVEKITRGSDETILQALCYVYYMFSLDIIVFLLTVISLYRGYKYRRSISIFYLLLLPVMCFAYAVMCARQIEVDNAYTMFLMVKPYLIILTYIVAFLLILLGIRKQTINKDESDTVYKQEE